MYNISANSMTPQEWVSILEAATSSHKPRSSKQDRQYITSQKGQTYSVSPQSQLDEQNSKLSLSEIVQISEKARKTLQDSFVKSGFSESEITEKEKNQFTELSKKISIYTEQLIKERETKRNQFGWKLARGVALVLSVLSSPLLIGIFFLYQLRKLEKNFNQEISGLINAIDTLPADELLNIPQQIKEKVNIPNFLKKVGECIKDENRSDMFQRQWDKDFPKEKNIEYIDIFRKDMLRDITFCRKDEQLKIDDKTPQPSDSDGQGEAKLKRGHELIQELVSNENDSSWLFSLQLAINQRSLINLFGSAISIFNLQAMENNLTWKGLDGQDYAIKACFSDRSPPINVEIIRNAQTQQIEQVNVKVEGSLDIVSYSTGAIRGKEHVLVPNAIQGELTYSIKLDENRNPVISDLHSSLKEIK